MKIIFTIILLLVLSGCASTREKISAGLVEARTGLANALTTDEEKERVKNEKKQAEEKLLAEQQEKEKLAQDLAQQQEKNRLLEESKKSKKNKHKKRK